MYGGGRAEATMSYCLFDKLELFKLYDLFFLFLNDVRECGQPVALRDLVCCLRGQPVA